MQYCEWCGKPKKKLRVINKLGKNHGRLTVCYSCYPIVIKLCDGKLPTPKYVMDDKMCMHPSSIDYRVKKMEGKL